MTDRHDVIHLRRDPETTTHADRAAVLVPLQHHTTDPPPRNIVVPPPAIPLTHGVHPRRQCKYRVRSQGVGWFVSVVGVPPSRATG